VKRAMAELCDEIEEETPRLKEHNENLVSIITRTGDLLGWATGIKKHLAVGGLLASNTEVHPEVRYNEATEIHDQMKETEQEIDPMDEEYKSLITEDETKKSKAAFETIHEWMKTKALCLEVFEAVEVEYKIIQSDWDKYNEYLSIMGEYEPWIEETEALISAPLSKPETLEDCQNTLDKCKEVLASCEKQKEAIVKAAKARDTMAKKNAAENKIGPYRQRLEVAAMHVIERVYKMTKVEGTWSQLQKTTKDLAEKMQEITKAATPQMMEEMNKCFQTMKVLNEQKKQILANF